MSAGRPWEQEPIKLLEKTNESRGTTGVNEDRPKNCYCARVCTEAIFEFRLGKRYIGPDILALGFGLLSGLIWVQKRAKSDISTNRMTFKNRFDAPEKITNLTWGRLGCKGGGHASDSRLRTLYFDHFSVHRVHVRHRKCT